MIRCSPREGFARPMSVVSRSGRDHSHDAGLDRVRLVLAARPPFPLVSDFVFGFSLNSRAARVPLVACQDDRESSLRVPSIT